MDKSEKTWCELNYIGLPKGLYAWANSNIPVQIKEFLNKHKNIDITAGEGELFVQAITYSDVELFKIYIDYVERKMMRDYKKTKDIHKDRVAKQNFLQMLRQIRIYYLPEGQIKEIIDKYLHQDNDSDNSDINQSVDLTQMNKSERFSYELNDVGLPKGLYAYSNWNSPDLIKEFLNKYRNIDLTAGEGYLFLQAITFGDVDLFRFYIDYLERQMKHDDQNSQDIYKSRVTQYKLLQILREQRDFETSSDNQDKIKEIIDEYLYDSDDSDNQDGDPDLQEISQIKFPEIKEDNE